MATHEVPGSNPANNDELAMGCWAEHEDGSLLIVNSTEGGDVIYEMFDVSKDPPISYRDVMKESDFKSYFSWKSGDSGKGKKKKLFKGLKPGQEKWLWHDKTAFPWDRVVDEHSGQRYASAAGQLSAAERVAQAIGAEGKEIEKSQYGHKLEQTLSKVNTMMDKFNRAISELSK